jgi:RNA polymerase sigma-70 factor (ECF subfamily)
MIDALPEELRQPLVLSSIEEMTSAQIAAALGVPEGTVRTRIHRARALLKQKLGPELETRHAR